MQESNTLDRHESPEERMQRRRARRWRRRARMAGPFVGLSALLGTLALSVDLIEYQPQVQKNRLSDRPLPAAVANPQPERPRLPGASMGTSTGASMATSVSSASVVTARPYDGDARLDVTLGVDAVGGQDLDRELAPPPSPYALRGLR